MRDLLTRPQCGHVQNSVPMICAVSMVLPASLVSAVPDVITAVLTKRSIALAGFLSGTSNWTRYPQLDSPALTNSLMPYDSACMSVIIGQIELPNILDILCQLMSSYV